MANLASDGDINSNIENTSSGCIRTTALKYTQKMNVDTETNNKLILFVHFHKCGGSSIVNIFKKNNFQAYPINSNGNPKNEKHQMLVKYHKMDLMFLKMRIFLLCSHIKIIRSKNVFFENSS